jgi:hypothetical protein
MNSQRSAAVGLLLAMIVGAGSIDAWAQTTGQIQGKVVTASGGAPISGATVIAQRTSPKPIIRSQSVKSASDGSFTIGSVLPGTYVFCVTDGTGTLLNPCEWSDLHPTTVTVTAGTTTGSVSVAVPAASTLQVRLNDPQFLSTALSPGKSAPPLLMVAVHGLGGSFHPAYVLSKDATGINYNVKIPYDTTLLFHLQSSQLAILDGSQNAVPSNGYMQQFEHHANLTAAQQTTFTFQVTGIQP